MRRCRLGVVEPLHAGDLAQWFDAVRWVSKCRQGIGHIGNRCQSGLQHQRRCGKRIGDVVRQRSRHPGDGSDGAHRAHKVAVGDAVVGVGRGECARDPASGAEVTHHHGVVGEPDGDIVRTTVRPYPRFSCFVRLHRPVPVLVVGGQVEPHRGLRTKAVQPVQPEAAALDDEHIDIVVERGHEWYFGVPHCSGSVAGHLQHVRRKQRGGGLPVGTRDRQHRSRPTEALLLPLVGQVDLRADRRTTGQRCDDHGVCLRHTGCRAHDVALRHQRRQRRDIGAFDERGSQTGGECPLGVVRRVVGHEYAPTTTH